MKLVDFVRNRKSINEDAIIFIENATDWHSDIIIVDTQGEEYPSYCVEGKEYVYFLEVFLANEFIDDLHREIKWRFFPEKTAKRLFEYGINDA